MHHTMFLCLCAVAMLSQVLGCWSFLLQHDGWDMLDMPRDIPLPTEQYYDLQRVDHFDGSNIKYWKQRYFVNPEYHRPGGPVFLLLGGNEEANPAWIVHSALTTYAAQHGAMLVMLEHRYYGKSHPVDDMSTANLKYLSSRQALADVARFLTFLPPQPIPKNATVLVFGKGYGGSLAAWFRAKYPYIVAGAVTSAARMVALYDYQDFFMMVGQALDTTGTTCSANIMDASGRMYDWWGQADKRAMMEKFFRMCHKIDHSSMIDVTVFFYNIAHYFEMLVLNNKLNVATPSGVSYTIDQICDVMSDDTRGDTIQRYGDVTKMLMDSYKTPCLDIRYTSIEAYLRQTDWNSTAAKGGNPIAPSRPWMYQLCAEFGWAKSSWSRKQPFGLWFAFPFNYTMDKCISAFNFVNVDDNVQETNMHYGGLDITVSNVVFVNAGMDPWRSVGVTMPLAHSPGADIINIPGASHCADMYPPSKTDSADLTKGRQQIASIIGGWLANRR